jgi:phage shock protein A
MALPVRSLELEDPLEERVARLEANVEHIQKDVAEMKIDIRRLDNKIDSVKDSVTALALKMEQSFAAVEKSLGEMRVSAEKAFSRLHVARAFDRVWWLLMSGALLAVMARAFKWI